MLPMVAGVSSLAPPVVPTPSAAVRRMGFGPVRFTVGEALRMVEHGILPEDSTIELLDGSLVYRDRFDLHGSEVVLGVKHGYVVCSLANLGTRLNNARRHLSSQITVICCETHAPIADAAVLRGALCDDDDGLPTAADAFCVIEVADSSYERDSGEKLNGYARAGVQQYIILNLRNRTAEVYRNPNGAAGTYPPPQMIAEGESLSLRVGEAEYFTVPLKDLLP